jgi:hypothetical protein
VFTKNFYFIKKKKKGFNAEGYILVLGTWPVYTFTFLTSLLRIKIPFISTPKNKTGLIENVILVIPQLITVLVLTTGIAYKISVLGLNFDPSISILFALFMILLHTGLFFAVWESYIFNKKNKKQSADSVSSLKEIIFENGYNGDPIESKQVQQKMT